MNENEFYMNMDEASDPKEQVMLIPPMQPWPPVSILDTRVTFWPLTKYLVKLYFASVLAGLIVLLIWVIIAGAMFGALVAVAVVLGSFGAALPHM